jgi:capsule synthesis protein PGA_cap
MSQSRLALIFGLLLIGVLLRPQPPPTPAPRDPQRELATSVADGFTVAAVGDCIIARPVSQTAGFAPVARLLHDADVAFGNFEGTALDLTRTPAVRQAEFGGVWIIGTPAVARDLKTIGFDVWTVRPPPMPSSTPCGTSSCSVATSGTRAS